VLMFFHPQYTPAFAWCTPTDFCPNKTGARGDQPRTPSDLISYHTPEAEK